MNISFIIVTNGVNAPKLELQKKSIAAQGIKQFEIIVAGDWKEQSDIIYLPHKELTDKRLLGALRNRACERAQYENLVISDDDMLFTSDWYKELLKSNDFDILTSRVRLPDGGRYWDHATYHHPETGHSILEGDTTSDHLYMSGGQSWVMKNKVFHKVKWDEEFDMAGGSKSMSNVRDYIDGKHNEDTDYSLSCNKLNFKIEHNHKLTVWHNDNSYTTLGRFCRRRQNGRQSDWVKGLDLHFPPPVIASMALNLFSVGFEAEGYDIGRYALGNNFKNPHLEDAVLRMEVAHGGKLSDVTFSADTHESYRALVEKLTA